MENFDTFFEQFGKAVKAAREARNWTQEELAEKTGYSHRFISDMESKGRSMDLSRFLYFAKLLNISVDQILFALPDEETAKAGRQVQAAVSNLNLKEIQFLIESIRSLEALRETSKV